MRQESFAIGIFYTLLSAVGTSFIGLLGKLGGAYWSLDALIFLRYVAAFSMCLTFLWFVQKKRRLSLSKGDLKLHFLRAFFVLVSQYSFYYYIQTNPLLNGLVLINLGPLFIPLIEWVVMRTSIGKSTWVGLIVSFVGMLFVLQPDHRIFSLISFIGVLSGLAQGCSQIVFAMSSRKERPEQSVLNMLFLCMGFSFFPFLITNTPHATLEYRASIAIVLILGIGFATVLTQFSRIAAYKHGTPSRLATFMYFSIVLGGFYDWAVFHKVPNIMSIIGAILVIAGGILKIFLRRRYLRRKQ